MIIKPFNISIIIIINNNNKEDQMKVRFKINFNNNLLTI